MLFRVNYIRDDFYLRIVLDVGEVTDFLPICVVCTLSLSLSFFLSFSISLSLLIKFEFKSFVPFERKLIEIENEELFTETFRWNKIWDETDDNEEKQNAKISSLRFCKTKIPT